MRTGWRPTYVALMALALCACRSGSRPDAAGGQVRLHLEPGGIPRVERVDYVLRFYWLDPPEPLLYNEVGAESAENGGELVAVLPCRTTADGAGLNQVVVEAAVHLEDVAAPVRATASTLFRCVHAADVAVNVVLSLSGPLNAGFVDLGVGPSAAVCQSKAELRGDADLGVCAESSCDDRGALFLFTNQCTALGGRAPLYWACGLPADWTILDRLAQAHVPIPPGDVELSYQVLALDPLRMAPDPTLTDGDGFLRVWGAMPNPRAVLTRIAGEPRATLTARRVADFVADLEVAPLAGGEPAPRVALVVRNSPAGARPFFWTRFGVCDRPVLGVLLYAGQTAIDVRLASAREVTLTLSAQTSGVATAQARCRTTRAADNGPAVTCDAAGPLR
jgi:hypothetical protein